MNSLLTKKFWRYPLPYLLEAFLFSPFFIALIFSALIIVFIPKSAPYLLEQTDKWQVNKVGGISFFSDLDGDGVSEYLIVFNNATNNKAIRIETQQGAIIDQYNFDGFNFPRVYEKGVYVADYDQNGYMEVYTLYWRNDSVFVDYFSPLDPDGVKRKSLFLDTIADYSQEHDFYAALHGVHDFDKDGFQELIFFIHAGFSLQPRNLYLYNREKQTLIKSPRSGVSFFPNYFIDLNGDGKDELIGITRSIGNITPNQSIPYRDSSSYVMVLKDNLKFLFEPFEFPVYPSSVNCVPFFRDNDTLILSLFFDRSKSQKGSQFVLMNAKGLQVDSKPVLETSGAKEAHLYRTDRGAIQVYFSGLEDVKLYEVDKELHLNHLKTFVYFSNQLRFDLDKDGQKEFVVYSQRKQQISVIRADYSHVVALELSSIESNLFNYSLKLNGQNPPELFVQTGPVCMLFSYTKNPLFAYHYLSHIFIFLLMWLLLSLLKRLYKYQTERQLKVQYELTKLQYQTVSHQIDPHFILNAMNSISAAIMAENAEDAYQLSAKFSKLFRETLTANDKVTRSLENELLFVENYLQIEQKRFDNRFAFEINTAPEVDTEMEIPKMLVQIYAENAVKHGLRHLDKNGLLRITVTKTDHKVSIILSDNGIGREKAKSISISGTGKGMDITQEMVRLYQKLNGVPIHLTMKDLYDEVGKPKGTRVEIVIPVKA